MVLIKYQMQVNAEKERYFLKLGYLTKPRSQ